MVGWTEIPAQVPRTRALEHKPIESARDQSKVVRVMSRYALAALPVWQRRPGPRVADDAPVFAMPGSPSALDEMVTATSRAIS